MRTRREIVKVTCRRGEERKGMKGGSGNGREHFRHVPLAIAQFIEE
jgi:hypothetical protein